MFKRLLYSCVALCYSFFNVSAQDTSAYRGPKCGFSPATVVASSSSSAVVIPSGYYIGAIKNCGHFQLYFDDVNLGTGDGFNEGSGIGPARQDLLCTVLTYVQSVFDFNSIPPNYPIRLHIKRSFTNAYGAAAHSSNGLVDAGPYYDLSTVAGDTVNGYVWDYVKDSVDPALGSYHAYIQANFDSVTRFPDEEFLGAGGYYGGTYTAISWNEGLDTPGCAYDLYSAFLHAVGHCMGWLTWQDGIHGIPTDTLTSNLTLALHQSPDIHTLTSSLTLAPYNTTYATSPYVWINDKQPPYNHPVMEASLSHFDDDADTYQNETRISPGDIQDYVMEQIFYQGQLKRKYLKGDLETFHDILGYAYTHVFDSANAVVLANHAPWSNKMSFRYNPIYDTTFHDLVTADFTMTNDSSNTVVYNLASDTTLKDADFGDTIRIYPGSLVNFRGGGEGGNNHDLLTVDATGQIITYAPRHNFYGRCQYGFNLWDGKEKGAFVLITIDVARGNNVSFTKGDNLVLNGGFEEGSEVKTLNNGEYINNSNFMVASHITGRLAWGYHFKDAQPSFNETAIQYSYTECSQSTKYRMTFGNPDLSFPWLWPAAPFGPFSGFNCHYPDSSAITGSRYETLREAGLYILGDTLKKCRRYLLEFDAMRPHISGYPYPLADTIKLGFADYDHGKHPDSTNLLRELIYKTTAIHSGSWTHIKVPFTYCSDTNATALYLQLAKKKYIFFGAPYLMDNLSLKEVDLTVSIIDSNSGRGCLHTLIADLPGSFGCDTGMQYSWKKLGSPTVLSISSSIDVNNRDTTYYIVTVSDGCNTAADTVRIDGCSCSADRLFTTAGYTTISGLYTGTTGTGNYYVDNDLTITRTTLFSDAKMYMAPGVTLTVLDSVKLTLERSHLFTCPDTALMWKGVVLNSGSTSSGTIAVIDNSMIEDAEIGIKAINPKTPFTGDIINCESAIFNSNMLGIYIENYTPSSPSTYPFSFVNSVFSSRLFNTASYVGYPEFWPDADDLKTTVINGVKPPFYIDRYYAKIKCKNNQQAEAGIKLKNVGDERDGSYAEIVIGGGNDSTDKNLYDNMGAGIFANNSNISAYNNSFINMPFFDRPLSPVLVPATYVGCGIYVSSDKSVKNRLQVKQLLGVNGDAFNKFYDCYKGISSTNYYELDLSNNFITGSHRSYGVVSLSGLPVDLDYGIDVSIVSTVSPSYNRYRVRDNVICNRYTGITMNLSGINPAATTQVTDNKLYGVDPFVTSATTAGQYMKQGIRITSGAVLPITYVSASVLDVSHDSLFNVYNGIALNNIQHLMPKAEENYVTLTQEPGTLKAQYGVSVNNCYAATIGSNVITSNLGDPIKNSDKARAFYTTYSNRTTLCSNMEGKIGRGFDFGQITGQAIRWVGNYMDSNLKGFVLGADIGDQASLYGTTTLWHKAKAVEANLSYWSTGGWSLGRPHTYVENFRLSANSKLYVRTIPASEKPTQNFSNPARAPYWYDTTSIIPANGTAAVCEMSSRSESAGGGLFFKIIADSLGYGTDGKVSQWLGQFGVYKAGIADPEQLDSSYGYNQFMASATGSRFEWLTAIEDALGNEDTAAAAILLNNTISAAGRIQVDSNITITDYTDANYVVDNYLDYYNFYLAYLQGLLDTNDLPAIEAIANLCPATYGAVVYQARAFYDMLTDQNISYEDDGCMDISESRVVAKGIITDIARQYNLYPNPNDGNMSIRQYIFDDRPVQLMLYDLQGRMIYASTLNFNQRSDLTLHIPSAMPGMYFVRLRDAEGKNYTLKFQVK